jgi:aminoglycoside phosphotransferase (APT) family kinase protein
VRGEHLVGVLDGGGFGPADPALDLVAAWHLLDYEERKTWQAPLSRSSIRPAYGDFDDLKLQRPRCGRL